MGPKTRKLKRNIEVMNEENQLHAIGSYSDGMDKKFCSIRGTAVTLTEKGSLARQLLDIEKEQCEELMKLNYGKEICYIYNPVEYANEIHEDFVTKFCNGEKKLLMLGMNPGPWGMGQTGVPFGHVGYARDWLGVKGNVSKPLKEHPKRPISGLLCPRNEVSGDRLWSLLKELSGSPEVLFSHVFLHNYCPIFFLKDSAKNVTPPELKVKERANLEAICDKALVKTVQLLRVEHIVGVGNYAAHRAQTALLKADMEAVKVSTLMHPSPVNPAANKEEQVYETCVHMNIDFKMTNEEDQWMLEAFHQAREALAAGEVPVGCVFVYDGEIIAKGRNTVNETHNATRHAEMNCVDQLLEWCQDKHLNYKTVFPKVNIYVTVEPCGMCADALGQLCVKNIVYGCSNDRFGGCGSVVDVPKLYKYQMNFKKGVQAEEAVELLKEFYKGENPNAPTGKVKRKMLKN